VSQHEKEGLDKVIFILKQAPSGSKHDSQRVTEDNSEIS
jgi:hypothetical protein